MNYYEIRSRASKLIPRWNQFLPNEEKKGAVKEKGRKSNYHQFHLERGKWEKRERLLNTEEINSFLEISLRAQACPMPLNLDTWDGLLCPFLCKYCVPSGTPILMADGSQKVAERVRKGDRIMSYNTEEGKPEIAIVEETMSRIAKEVISITTPSSVLKATPEHPVFTKRGWIKAEDLTKEDEVMVW